jgi:hypothetical protein
VVDLQGLVVGHVLDLDLVVDGDLLVVGHSVLFSPRVFAGEGLDCCFGYYSRKGPGSWCVGNTERWWCCGKVTRWLKLQGWAKKEFGGANPFVAGSPSVALPNTQLAAPHFRLGGQTPINTTTSLIVFRSQPQTQPLNVQGKSTT